VVLYTRHINSTLQNYIFQQDSLDNKQSLTHPNPQKLSNQVFSFFLINHKNWRKCEQFSFLLQGADPRLWVGVAFNK
jgi:hypothetical protein